ncbi:MAG: hybrid sensor histidine kinase/response regulator [Butyrivibrio sp.]
MKDEEQLIQIFNHMDTSAVYVFGEEEGSILYINDAAEKFSGKNLKGNTLQMRGYSAGISFFQKELGERNCAHITFEASYGDGIEGDVFKYRLWDKDCIVLIVPAKDMAKVCAGTGSFEKIENKIFELIGMEWRSVLLANMATGNSKIIRSRFSDYSDYNKIYNSHILKREFMEKYVHPGDREYFETELSSENIRKIPKNGSKNLTIRLIRNKEVRYVQIQVMKPEDEAGRKYIIFTEKDIHEVHMFKMLARENGAVMNALCNEYNSMYIIHTETGEMAALKMAPGNEKIIRRTKYYEDILLAYCTEYVSEQDRSRLLENGKIDRIVKRLDETDLFQVTYQTKDGRWMAARFMNIDNPYGNGRNILLGIIKYDKNMILEQKTKRTNEIITSLSEAYQVIYRVNIITGWFEIILMNFDTKDFVDGFDNFFDMEKNYYQNGIDIEFVENTSEKMDHNMVKAHMDAGKGPISAYYKEKSDRWVKLTISPEQDYSPEHPYLIYAIKECNEQIHHKTEVIVNRTAISKMYILSIIIDSEAGTYDCMYSIDNGLPMGPGLLKDFMAIMKKMIYEEDYHIFASIFDELNPEMTGFIEKEYRAEDNKGMFHFLSAFATVISVPEGNRILLLVRNIDERAANRARMSLLNREYDMVKNMLYALGENYFGMYYCNVETQQIVPARRGKDMIEIFNEESTYDKIMERYVKEWVYPADREAVGKFTNLDKISGMLQKEGQSIFVEYQRVFGNVYRWVRLEVQAIKCDNDRATEIVFAFKDIHDEKASELQYKRDLSDALERAEKANLAKSEFLSNMSHDIRTPMNAVLGMTNIALAHLGDKEKVISCLEKIKVSGNHLLRLINEVLDMSHIESGKITLNEENFSLSDLMHGIMIMFQSQIKEHNHSFKAEAINVRNENLYGDRVKLNQILINVIGNAIKYTEDNGSVYVSVEQSEDLNEEEGQYVFTVRDNGRGMAEDFIDKIFLPFEREMDSTNSRIEGTGLGMPITHNFVEMMGGHIEVKSKVGEGSEFKIVIPFKYIDEPVPESFNIQDKYNIIYYEKNDNTILSKISRAAHADSRPVLIIGSYDVSDFAKEARNAGMDGFLIEPVFNSDYHKIYMQTFETFSEPGEQNMQKYDFQGRRILVVDDNEINADIACDYLEDVNAETDIAVNGKEAYDKIAEGGHYDAVLMDVRMPVMDGYEATRMIRGLGTEYADKLPIIAMTANAFNEDVINSRKAGMNEHISKPINADILYSVLHKALSHISE